MSAPQKLLQHAACPSGEIGLELARFMDAGNCWALLAALLALQPGSLLEIGFGGAGFYRRWRAMHPDSRYVGVDIAQTCAAAFRPDTNAQAIVGSADALPIDGETFDNVLALNSVYYWPDPVWCVCEMLRIARPGGTIVLGMVDAVEWDRMVAGLPDHFSGLPKPIARHYRGSEAAE
jgi:SAM-dependent methyltransferase